MPTGNSLYAQGGQDRIFGSVKCLNKIKIATYHFNMRVRWWTETAQQQCCNANDSAAECHCHLYNKDTCTKHHYLSGYVQIQTSAL